MTKSTYRPFKLSECLLRKMYRVLGRNKWNEPWIWVSTFTGQNQAEKYCCEYKGEFSELKVEETWVKKPDEKPLYQKSWRYE